ncbi:response regulator transcription factor [Schlesneria paludicola]|uniref:response regulator transcription factor n=1 Tax=Schlesneria paludicola TaxID=360056 RepID=UPI00029A3D01|nr:LuxR C-terminal-related transcriptional regulator [Schlesneria paludicola]
MQTSSIVLLHDNHDQFVDYLVKQLSLDGFTTEFVETCEELIPQLHASNFASVIVRLGTEQLEGLRILEELHRKQVPLAAIAVLENSNISAIVEAARHGTVTFLLRENAGPQEIQAAVRTATEQTARLREAAEKRATLRALFSRLTTGETQVLERLVKGQKLMMIAEALDLSRRTVELRRAKLMHKLEVATFPELVALVIEYDRDRQDSERV